MQASYSPRGCRMSIPGFYLIATNTVNFEERGSADFIAWILGIFACLLQLSLLRVQGGKYLDLHDLEFLSQELEGSLLCVSRNFLVCFSLKQRLNEVRYSSTTVEFFALLQKDLSLRYLLLRRRVQRAQLVYLNWHLPEIILLGFAQSCNFPSSCPLVSIIRAKAGCAQIPQFLQF